MTDDLRPRLQRSLGDAFVIERELGGGGMARVFLAEERALGRRVVVKVLDLEGAVAASAERFRREVQVIARLQHPHIVPVLTAGGDDTLLWYVMPYVSGESLRARLLREGALPLADAVRIARELFDALGYAHEHGIVHRDVKPENILLEGRHAVVADFGVAKALAEAGVSGGLTSAGLALGTPSYMAPEQAMGDATTNHRADLYAAGAVLYEMLVGAPPFSGNAQAVIAAHMTAAVPRVEERRGDVPSTITQLIPRLMAKNAAERPQSAHEALTILEGVATPSGTTTRASVTAGPGALGGGAAASTATVAPAQAVIRSGRRRVLLLLVPALLLAATATWWKLRTPTSRVVEGADVIAVMPLGSTGDSNLTRLGRELVVTLSTSLDGVGSLRTVDAMSVLQGVKELPQPLRLEDALALGLRLGAKTVVHGVVTQEGAVARLDLGLYPVGGGDAIARASARAPADSIRTLTDTLTRQLIEQIWRRGTPPSPLLSEVTTSNGDALRAFLKGEAAFERLAMDTAIAAYAHAAALDSNFAQAWLRLDHSRGLVLLPTDTVVRRHLLSVRDRLPKRERDWLSIRFSSLPPLEDLDSARAIAARYPESYAIQYLVMDFFVHSGSRYGIAIKEALPLLERLHAISPKNVDIALHRNFVAIAMADTTAALEAMRGMVGANAMQGGRYNALVLRNLEALAAGRARSVADMAQVADSNDAFANFVSFNPDLVWFPTSFNFPFEPPSTGDSLEVVLSSTRFAAANPMFMSYGRATREIARGNVATGLVGMASFTGARAPTPVRTSAAWIAANAAWFGLIPVADAEAVLARAKPQLADLTDLGAVELSWAEGVIAIAAKDSVRMEETIRGITDTSGRARALPRGLRALWRERSTGESDSLRAYEEEAMRTGTILDVSLPIHRAALGRALLRSGDAAGAERLLQWPDMASSSVRGSLLQFEFAHYTSYERGLAAEAMGDTRSAIRFYNDFVVMIDRPPPVMEASMKDAKARLAKLAGDVARR